MISWSHCHTVTVMVTCHKVSDAVHTEGKSLQDSLRNMQTCGMTLASAYVLHHLSAA